MFFFYVLRFFKKGDTIQGGTLFKGGHYLRKYGINGKKYHEAASKSGCDHIGGFQLLNLIIMELKSHMTCYNSMPLIS